MFKVLEGAKADFYTYTVTNINGVNKEHLNSLDELSEWMDEKLGEFYKYPKIKAIQDQTGRVVVYSRKAKPRWGAVWIKTESFNMEDFKKC